jgi:uncharacterized protein YegP (UPF0339 family)
MMVIVYQDESGEYRWHANGEIVSESGEGYQDKSYAIESAKKFGPTNAVIVTDHVCGRDSAACPRCAPDRPSRSTNDRD